MAERARRHGARAVVVVVLLLAAFAAPLRADQTDPRLGPLFARLRVTASAAEARGIEDHIWSIWLESGKPEVDAILKEGMAAMDGGKLERALGRFDKVVHMAPKFAEGWNKRATVNYLLGKDLASIADIRRTLALEPRHFGAISGLGLILMREGDRREALAAFERVLIIDPHAPGARANADLLRRLLDLKGA